MGLFNLPPELEKPQPPKPRRAEFVVLVFTAGETPIRFTVPYEGTIFGPDFWLALAAVMQRFRFQGENRVERFEVYPE